MMTTALKRTRRRSEDTIGGSSPSPTLILVCEGPCNPEFRELDALVTLARNGVEALRADDYDRLARLKHTRHLKALRPERAKGDPPSWNLIATCMICNTPRVHHVVSSLR